MQRGGYRGRGRQNHGRSSGHTSRGGGGGGTRGGGGGKSWGEGGGGGRSWGGSGSGGGVGAPELKLCKFFTTGEGCKNQNCNFAHALGRIAMVQADTKPVKSIAFNAASAQIISGSADGVVRHWACSNWQREAESMHGTDIHHVLSTNDFLLICSDIPLPLPDTTVIESISVGYACIIPHKTTAEMPLKRDEWMAHAHASSVLTATVINDGVLTAGFDGTIHEWAYNGQSGTFEFVRLYEGHVRAVTCLVFVPELNLLWSGSTDTTIRVWNTNGGCEGIISSAGGGHSAGVTCMDRLDMEGGVYIVTGGLDQQVCIFEAGTGAHMNTTSMGREVSCLRVMTDASNQTLLIVGLVDGRILIRSLPTLDLLVILDIQHTVSHTGAVRSIIVLDPQTFASAGEDGAVIVWQIYQPLIMGPTEGTML